MIIPYVSPDPLEGWTGPVIYPVKSIRVYYEGEMYCDQCIAEAGRAGVRVANCRKLGHPPGVPKNLELLWDSAFVEGVKFDKGE